MDKLTEKAQNFRVENATSGTRIESLENWSKKPSEKIDEGECHQTKQNFRERETYKKVFVRLIVSLKMKTAAEKKHAIRLREGNLVNCASKLFRRLLIWRNLWSLFTHAKLVQNCFTASGGLRSTCKFTRNDQSHVNMKIWTEQLMRLGVNSNMRVTSG